MNISFEPRMSFRREFSYKVYLPDGSAMYISDEPAGYERFIEAYAHYGDLKVEIRPFYFGIRSWEQTVLGTAKLSEMIEDGDLAAVEELKSLRKSLTEMDKHILSNLREDWVPPTTYEQLVNDKFIRSDLKKAMTKLRKLDLVEYYPGSGYCLSRKGVLIWEASMKPDHVDD